MTTLSEEDGMTAKIYNFAHERAKRETVDQFCDRWLADFNREEATIRARMKELEDAEPWVSPELE